MALTMNKDEREAFLADVHVGVISVAAEGRGPISAPIWYGYERGGDVVFHTYGNSAKAEAMRVAGRASLLVQRETLPYAYVVVEGAVTIEPESSDDTRSLAVRYLGEAGAERYLASQGAGGGGVRVRLHPERWRSEDYSKMG